MTANHVFYIPAMILIGFFIGLWVGQDQARKAMAEEEREAREREQRRRKRLSAGGEASVPEE